MHRLWFFTYKYLIFPLVYLLILIQSNFDNKIKKGIKDRKGLFDKLKEFRNSIGTDKKVILFHCVSMGELEQAKPLAKKIKEEYPGVKIAVSFLSPSGYDNLKKLDEFDFKTYMPPDTFGNAEKFFSILKPSLWIIVKHDIWPNHLMASAEQKIPSVLIDANLPETSKRAIPVIRSFFKSFYSKIDLILPVSEKDAQRFKQVYPFGEKIITAGDTRYDQVFIRSRAAKDKDVEYLSFYEDKKVLLLGSVWNEDLQNLLPAVSKLMSENKDIHTIIVPHEPEPEHLNYIVTELGKLNLSFENFTGLKSEPAERILIIDTIGILAALYKYSHISYVGGSFTTGVHNVMEPAVFENTVLFGPKHDNSFEALQMVERGGAFAINNNEDVYSIVSKLLENDDERRKTGKIAASVVMENLGATTKIMQHIKKYI